MKNKEKYIISLFLICLCSGSFVSANTNDNAIKLVTKFGHYIGAWTRNPGDIEARDGLKFICNNGQNMRVADRLALEKCTTTDDNTILLGSYLRIFEDRHNEKIDYIIYNPKVVKVATKYATDNTNIISVVADVEVKSASLNYMMKNVFYIKDNKICFIGDYTREIVKTPKAQPTPKKTQIPTSSITSSSKSNNINITNIEFVGLDKKGYEITETVPAGGVLRSFNSKKIRGLKINFAYAKLSEDVEVLVKFSLGWSHYYITDNEKRYSFEKGTTRKSIYIEYADMPQKTKVEIIIKDPGEKENMSSAYCINIDN